MRDKSTPTILFRQLLKEIALLMGYEVTRDLPMTEQQIETPVAPMVAPIIAGKKIAVVAILRAGLGMAEAMIELIPAARVGHIGLYRDPVTKRPVQYFVKLPEPEGRIFILCDPMLATGHSAAAAVDVLNKAGVADSDIRLLALVAAPEGVEVLMQGASRGADLCRRPRRAAERSRLYRAGAGRCRRPALRHQMRIRARPTIAPWPGRTARASPTRSPASRRDGDFLWRLSIAEVAADGDFSLFPGYRPHHHA